jgi:DNA processing protein
MSTEIESAIILQALPGIGATGLSQLLERFGSFDRILQAAPAELPDSYCKALGLYRGRRGQYHASAQHIVTNCHANGVSILTIHGDHYPPLLQEIDSPPSILYVKGDKSALTLPQIAIVGSRQHSAAGKNNALAFAQMLSANGFVITSGMALGIDAEAHRGAIQRGTTVAVLGTGIDVVYPRRHEQLYHNIIKSGGAIVTEFPPGTPARAGNFPQRNRIISGLSLGVLVVEAAIQSGSLITARLALNQGREVFAIPGSIHNPVSKGCHRLIKEGATLVETAEDIVTQLGGVLSFVAGQSDDSLSKEKSQQKSQQVSKQSSQLALRQGSHQGPRPDSPAQPGTSPHPDLDSAETRVLADLGFDFIDLDSLMSRCGLSAGELTAILTRLELLGLVDSRTGLYCRLS